MPVELSQEAKDSGFTQEHVKQMAAFLRQVMASKSGEVVKLHMTIPGPEDESKLEETLDMGIATMRKIADDAQGRP